MLPIPNFRTQFANTLHDILHEIVYHEEDVRWGEGYDKPDNMSQHDITPIPFCLVTVLLDHSPDKVAKGEEVLIYAGTQKQREILEKKGKYDDDDTNKAWAYLETDVEFTREFDDIKTFEYFDSFRTGEMAINTLYEVKYLNNYFSGPSNPVKDSEKAILKHYFNIEEDVYFAVPLLQFGQFEGVVFIVVNKNLASKLDNADTIKRLTKRFAAVYQDTLFSWDIVDSNMELYSEVGLDEILSPTPFSYLTEDRYYEEININPILKELNLKQHYENSLNSFKERKEKVDAVPKRIKEVLDKLEDQHRRNALTVILIDSYSHNVSAHSLSTLTWWFKGRTEVDDLKEKQYNDKDKKDDSDDRSYFDLIDTAIDKANNPLITYRIGDSKTLKPLARELYPMFKYLGEKGAFWSGITRRTNFGGRIKSFYHSLWHDFINNALFIGTIVHSEGVKRINFYVSIYENSETEGYNVKHSIKKDADGVPLTGHWASINLWDSGKENTEIDLLEKYPELEHKSRLVKLGSDFDLISKELKQILIFFPRGVVGKQALFTIIENELRNVKHYKDENNLHIIEKQGLDIHLTLEAISINPDTANGSKQLYKIGLWIDLPKETVNTRDQQIIIKKYGDLLGDIMDKETYLPCLGGNFQDKACASKLFNNKFGDVQNRKTARDKAFYPWLTVASADPTDKHTDFEINSQNCPTEKELEKASEFYMHKKGILKKYFYIWQGDDIYQMASGNKLDDENIARFKFVNLQQNNEDDVTILRKEGVVRIIAETASTISVAEVYQKWLSMWLNNQSYIVCFEEGGDKVGRIIYDKQGIRFETKGQIEDTEKVTQDGYDKYDKILTLRIAHGGKLSDALGICNYRTHGYLLQQVFKCNRMVNAQLENIRQEYLYDLLESLATRICIFDNRAVARLSAQKQRFYKDYLNCGIYQEDVNEWKKNRKDLTKNYHFVVVHLSFIASITNDKGELLYKEENISDFVRNEILADDTPCPDNFILIITTGRGRRTWFENLEKDNLTNFISFRPIESIISAIEDAVQIQDDIDLKYNLCKVLLGS
jgi:hypothetical protein